jgi:hypothetical protein
MRGALLAGMAVFAGCGPSSGPQGNCKDQLLAGDLVITEVFANYRGAAGGSGADAGKEWFEIYNASGRPLDLDGLLVTHSRPDGSRGKSHVMKSLTMNFEQYVTLGNAAPDLLPPYVDYGYANSLGDLFNSDGGRITLSCGGVEIDTATYEQVREGRSRQLTAASFPDYTLNDDPQNWCEGNTTEFEPANFGTPGFENDCVPVILGLCNDNGNQREVVSPEVGDLVITEVMPNPAAVSDTVGEWFEVLAMRDVDLNGVALDRAGDNANPRELSSSDCIHVPAGTYAVFARNADMAMNGGLPAEAIKGTFTFALIDGTAAAPGDVRLLFGSTVLDAITWTSTRAGRSHQLDPQRIDPVANDEESNFCDGTVVYGAGDRGTPGAENVACPLVAPAGMCIDNGNVRPIVKPTVGQLVITEIMPNPAGTETTREWFEITNVGSTAFDLNELGLDRTGDTRAPDLILSGDCKTLAPGGFALFARSNDPAANSGLPQVDATFGFSMPNTAGDVQVVDGMTVLDVVTYGNVSATSFDGKSLSLDPDQFTTTANDLPAHMFDTGVWCLGATAYGDGTNQGTPKAANPQCP